MTYIDNCAQPYGFNIPLLLLPDRGSEGDGIRVEARGGSVGAKKSSPAGGHAERAAARPGNIHVRP